ncbi:hypothetical protein RHA1_ro01830 [Rhodococcus jostii RHA1]|uniref:Uncharacterized protein n=1 Tax=Rhodococcus jostii (strain RHA1) TaxID=101510 RepID=Q0SFP5_RHOJR|nr:hypothetical protein RHA1_ro01830 [Rhodococcus jostii RHA1]
MTSTASRLPIDCCMGLAFTHIFGIVPVRSSNRKCSTPASRREVCQSDADPGHKLAEWQSMSVRGRRPRVLTIAKLVRKRNDTR